MFKFWLTNVAIYTTNVRNFRLHSYWDCINANKSFKFSITFDSFLYEFQKFGKISKLSIENFSPTEPIHSNWKRNDTENQIRQQLNRHMRTPRVLIAYCGQRPYFNAFINWYWTHIDNEKCLWRVTNQLWNIIQRATTICHWIRDKRATASGVFVIVIPLFSSCVETRA